MGDISLLFDVAGGGSLSGESGKHIQGQLQSIVSEINKTPFKIKFQADEQSIKAMQNTVQKITDSFKNVRLDVSTVGTASVKKSASSGIKLVKNDAIDARKQLDNLIADLERLKAKSSDSKARVEINGENFTAPKAIDATINKIQTYRDEVLTAKTTQESFNNALSGFKENAKACATAIKDNADAQARLKKADQENLRDSNALSKAIVATNRAYKQATDAVQKYTAAKKGNSSKEYADLERTAESLKSLNERLNSGAISQSEYIKEANRLRAEIQKATAVIKANGEAHLSLGDKIKNVTERFTQFFTAAKLVQIAWRAMQQMVRTSIELDSAFTQLKIVTGATNDEMKDFADTAITLSKNLGQSVVDVTKSIETFSRLGYNLPDASKLAEYATILANTAAVSTEEATTGLTSIIKGFGLNVSDTEHVANLLIQVGQKYAVSAAEMMEAYERSGAALEATNTSIEKSAGLIAAANASVQNASTVGVALKTISARIRGSKSELEELGEDVDELANGFSKYAEEIQALTGFNIMVEGTTDQFKDLYDIMEGMAGVWDKLSDTQQARVAEILGGTRQLQVISSIIGNWGDAAGAYADAMNSAGVATKANDTYMESAQAHINQFTATFQELSSNVADSNLIKFVVDFGTAILNVVNSVSELSDVFGSIPVIATTLSAILSIKNVGRDKMSSLSIVYMPTVTDFC